MSYSTRSDKGDGSKPPHGPPSSKSSRIEQITGLSKKKEKKRTTKQAKTKPATLPSTSQRKLSVEEVVDSEDEKPLSELIPKTAKTTEPITSLTGSTSKDKDLQADVKEENTVGTEALKTPVMANETQAEPEMAGEVKALTQPEMQPECEALTQTVKPTVEEAFAEAVKPTMGEALTQAVVPTVEEAFAEAVRPTMEEALTQAVVPTVEEAFAEAVRPTMGEAFTQATVPKVEEALAESVMPTMEEALAQSGTLSEAELIAEAQLISESTLLLPDPESSAQLEANLE